LSFESERHEVERGLRKGKGLLFCFCALPSKI